MGPNAGNGDTPEREDGGTRSKDLSSDERRARLKEYLLNIEKTMSTDTSPLMQRDLNSGLAEIAGSLIEFVAFARQNDLPFLAYLIEMAAMEVAKEIDDIEPSRR